MSGLHDNGEERPGSAGGAGKASGTGGSGGTGRASGNGVAGGNEVSCGNGVGVSRGRSPVPRGVTREPVQAQRTVVFVCHGPSCTERGSPQLCAELRERLNESSARRGVRVCETSCLDHCPTGPNVLVGSESELRAGLTADCLDEFEQFLAGGAPPGG